MDRAIYENLIDTRNFREAHQYRIKNAPDALYKYMSFSNNDNENEEKLQTLCRNQIWLSTREQLNDPFELKGVHCDNTTYPLDTDFKIGLQKSLDMINSNKLICSFTEHTQNSMPMWAHYANNHNGLCVKYKVLAIPFPIHLYPVIYTHEKKEILNLEVVNIILRLQDFINTNEYSTKLAEINQIINHFPIIKHTSWSYENEFRLVYEYNGKQNIPLEEVSLAVDCIYVGYNCSKDKLDRIKQIAGHINCEAKHMTFNNFSENFELIDEEY